MNICLVCESVEQEGESDPPPEPPKDETPPEPTPPPVSYPIYAARTYPDKESDRGIVYSFSYDPDNLFVRFGVDTERHEPYKVEFVKHVGDEAYQIVTERLLEYVKSQPEQTYPQKFVVEQNGITKVDDECNFYADPRNRPHGPVVYPIYVVGIEPDRKHYSFDKKPRYSFGHSPDKLVARFCVVSDYKPYEIECIEQVSKETFQTVEERLRKFVNSQPKPKYPKKIVIERDGVSGVEW